MTATTVARLLADHQLFEMTVEGPAAGGEVGAYFGRRSDGRRVVFKWFERLDWADDLTRMLTGVEQLRTKGYPIPAHEPLMVIPGALVVVQEAIEGGVVLDRITHGMLDRVLELIEFQAGVGDGGDTWSSFIATTLTIGADRWCLHEPVRRHSSRTAAILARVQNLGADLTGRQLPHGDIGHMDYHHRNILQSGDEPIAVIDWEGSMPGDRVFDLVTLGFCAGVAETEAGVENRIWGQVKTVGDPEAVAAYISHMALRRLDWTVRHHPDEVTYWVERSEQLLGEYA